MTHETEFESLKNYPAPAMDKLAVHTFTNKPWSADECIANYAAAGVKGITWWRETYAGQDLAALRRRAEDAGLTAAGVARCGFYTGNTAKIRTAAVDENKKAIDESEAIGAPVLVLVCGATPGQTVATNLDQIVEGVRACVDHARAAGVKLAIEPLHPAYAGNRSAVASLGCANWVCDQINEPEVGIAVDVYHVFWEHDLEAQIKRCAAANRLFAFHICDYKAEPAHLLLDRGLMGEGVIDVRGIRRMVEATGFEGFNEVEIFSQRWWSENQHDYLGKIVEAYRERS